MDLRVESETLTPTLESLRADVSQGLLAARLPDRLDRHVGVERVGKDFLSRNTSRYRFTSPLQPTRLPQLGEKHRQTALKTFAVKRLVGQSSEQR